MRTNDKNELLKNLDKLKTVPMALNDIEFFINKANKIYCEKDRNFASAIRRDRNNYE